MKFLNVPIAVEARKGVPRRIRWGRRIYTVRRLLDFWILQSRWWAREEKRVYFRIETDQGVMEVYRGEETQGTWSGSTDGAKRSKGEDSRVERRSAPKLRQATLAHPPFIEGDTHTREVRQTESPYRPDAADLASRRLSQADGSGSGSNPTREQALPTSGEVRYRDADPSSRSARKGGWRWVLSKVID